MFNPTRSFNFGLIALIAINILPHLESNFLVGIFVVVPSLILRLLFEFQKVKLPHWLIKLGFILLSFALVYFQQGSIIGPEPASALLICGVALKLIDRVSYRDAMISLFLVFMLIMARFLVDQSLPITLMGGADVILVVTLLFQLHRGPSSQLRVKELLRLTLKVLLQSAPLLFLLFVVFPRFSVGFFSLNNESVGQIGFSDEITPGDIAQLASSERTAFRVIWKENQPKTRDLYWRGEVLTISKGFKWSVDKRKKEKLSSAGLSFQSKSKYLIEYEILLAPYFGKWLFLLDTPKSVQFSDPIKNRQTYKNRSHSVFSIKSNNGQNLFYTGKSVLQEGSDKISANYDYLQTDDGSDKIEEWVKALKKQSKNEKEFVDSVLNFFSKNFKYSLSPGVMKTSSMEDFFFNKKIGFCEHFAALFAYIMRVGGIPSRVVVGFQGGRKNSLSDYLIVQEKDAHAWTEIWDKSIRSWIRVDPTAFVAPARISLGGQVYHQLASEGSDFNYSDNELQRLYESSVNENLLLKIKLAMDLASLRWQQFLLTYDLEKQKEILSYLGINRIEVRHLGLISFFITLFFILYLRYTQNRKKPKLSSTQKYYIELQKLLAAKGLNKSLSEGPYDFLRRCHKTFPEEIYGEIHIFLDLYIQKIYGDKFDSQRENEFKRSLMIIKSQLKSDEKVLKN
ncbi:MAG: DUF3488 domain-containing transglutaminase family protein [Bdellovibrionales bacterium]|nr:DUF3488 domain-containing transglutaminase family protein [Bdellovibrionales bacterium]